MRRLAVALLLALAPRAGHALPPPPATLRAPAAVDGASAAARDRAARRWAPTIYQETRDVRDLVTAFDFDGDWDLSNNVDHVATHPLYAVVYYTVVETDTHFIVTYVPYHPVDAKVPSGHDHDTEHVTCVIRKDGSPGGRLEVMETRFHKWLYDYAAPDAAVRDGAGGIDGAISFDVDGHPLVYAQRVGHGLCGGFAPIAWWNALALECRHHETPHIARRGVVYRYRGRAEVPRSTDDRDVGYDLVEIGSTLWPRAREAGPHAVFSSLLSFKGPRCAKYVCPQNVGGLLAAAVGHGSTGLPWQESPGRGGQARGEAFFDPAWVMSRRLTFHEPFSTDYRWNPYLGVGRFAP